MRNGHKGQGMVEYALIMVLVAVVVIAAVHILGEVINSSNRSTSSTPRPTHLVCFQHGQVIVDTTTRNGYEIKVVDMGRQNVYVWAWEDENGSHTLEKTESVSCLEEQILQ
jgi:Flp pilus assembly pilin Flp